MYMLKNKYFESIFVQYARLWWKNERSFASAKWMITKLVRISTQNCMEKKYYHLKCWEKHASDLIFE